MDVEESAALLRRAKAGSREAMDLLYGRIGGKLLGLIRLRMGSGLRANLESRDILQAVMLRSFQRIERLERSDTGSLMAWLARIAENEIRDRADFHARQRRDAARNVPLEEGADVAASVRSALSQAIWDERAECLERALETLDAGHREVILLRKFEELGFREIGKRMGKTEDASRMQFARAMAALTLAMGGLP
ncbi:MAG: RNA polymerase sigma factor [Acidobacteriota bacterium]